MCLPKSERGVGKQQGGRWRRETKQGKQQRVKTLMNAHFLLVLDKWQIYRKPDSAGGRATPFNEFS